MYRYKCTAAENAGKQDFYDVIGQLREMYPELTEDLRVKSDNEFLRREFVRGKNLVMVQYSFSEQSITVYSEEWLEKYYGERKVEEVQFPMRRKAGARTMWVISGIYFAVIALLIVICLMAGFYFYSTNTTMSPLSVLILAAAYTLSGIIIRRLTGMSFPKLILCQAIGFVSAIAVFMLIIAFAFGFSFSDFFTSYLFILVYLLLRFFLPALAISLLLQGVTELIIKKIHNTKSAKGEDITETM